MEVVRPGRYLRYRWWPADGDGGPASVVAYLLETDRDGTRLTVQETVVGGADTAAPGIEAPGGVAGRAAEAELASGPPEAGLADSPNAAGASAAPTVRASLAVAAAPEAPAWPGVEATWTVRDDRGLRIWARSHRLATIA